MKVKLEKDHSHEGIPYKAGETIEIGNDPDRLAWLVKEGVVAAKAPAKGKSENSEE